MNEDTDFPPGHGNSQSKSGIGGKESAQQTNEEQPEEHFLKVADSKIADSKIAQAYFIPATPYSTCMCSMPCEQIKVHRRKAPVPALHDAATQLSVPSEKMG
ncbi:hypothetical protein N7499_004220 [Penicillium canescens]|uniref:Uncharacterized protein n=1 Tax=Penicillium canescens TaxID=5083 RepID=A0AAD6IA58_PENCN|nr:uncharacterized protein N7446_005088 [Penicillium canescens]KAJ6038274.1 hypothetical protein N7460_008045 [Penicillium canescens]KAJ6039605.1 hypothetical protein N7444_008510 [Penicillium canescens]KAJ6068051.1 hypothetical protein N7446_005088 [Penicillium canescens]KAJ6088038.1 hypothetical protein N7499_004220 [Penicillium canescens]KAJ6181459.1 hypothetical protein N7485_000101 [Penicillium canescens]